MNKFFSLSLALYIFMNLFMQANKGYAYFFPILYENTWTDFCLEHLKELSDECNEQYIDKELIARLSYDSNRIPTTLNSCDFRSCLQCQAPAARRLCIDEDWTDEEENVYEILCYKCRCLKNWYNPNNLDADEEDLKDEEIVDEYWDTCSNKAIPHSYFTIQAKPFVCFLEQHLKYCKENSSCLCYWPYLSKIACEISDTVYTKGYSLVENSFLGKLNSPEFNSLDFASLNTYGILTALFTHSFFYSQYRQVLLQLAQWEESHDPNIARSAATIDSIYITLDSVQPHFLHLYSQCLKKHPHPKIYYERGMVLFHQGKALDSLDDIRALIGFAQQNHHQDLLTSELYLQEGTVYAELGLYDEAVVSLSEAIHRDPNNKQAYFERAVAYFELGQFDLSLEDYFSSKIKPQPISPDSLELVSFSLGLTQGILKGGMQAGAEFLPSLLSSMQGIGHGLWAFAQDPVQVSVALVEAMQACIQFVKNHTSTEALTSLVPELKELIETWDKLENNKRGEITGHIIGKYGVDIFAGTGLIKGMKLYRELKKANNLLTLEALATSKKNKSLISLEAAKRAQTRKAVLTNANVKIQWDKQGKHIQTHKNFQKSKSILEHPNPQKLAHDFCGKGMKIGNQQAGTAGYQEIVDFKEFIGYSVEYETGKKTATSWGKIHYAKGGVHIVPTKPRL